MAVASPKSNVAKPTTGKPKTAGPSPGPSLSTSSIWLPLRFILTGLLALLTAVILLVWRPTLLTTYHYNQHIIAVTHLFVLGWIGSVVMGAMYQLVPIALETRLYSERLARWHFVLHLVGFTGMVWMFWTWRLTHVGHFGSVLVAGVGLFLYNIGRTLARVPRWSTVASAVTSGLLWLGLTVLAGLSLTIAKCSYDEALEAGPSPLLALALRSLQSFGRWVSHLDAIGAMHAHAHLGVVGVFVLLILGISYKLVPMFTLSEVQSALRARLALGIFNIALLGQVLTIATRSRLKFGFALLLAGSLIIYGIEMRAILRARRRRALDWGLRGFLTALLMLIPVTGLGALLAWPALPLTALTGQLENLYGFLALAGVVSFAIIGMLYKIVPFLIWYKSYSRQIGRARVPALADLHSATIQAAGYWSYLAGLLVTNAGIVMTQATVTRAGCVLLATSLLMLILNVAKMLRHLVAPEIQPLEPSRPSPAAAAFVSKPAITSN